MDDNILQVHIFRPEGEVLQTKALALSSVNPVGTFDILPGHHPFISVIGKQLRLILPNKQSRDVSFNQGIVRCKENRVDVYIDIPQIAANWLESDNQATTPPPPTP